MKFTRRSKKMLVEPPAVMLTDLAFNLVIFFVVCASTDPESGRKQEVPSSRKEESAAAQMAKATAAPKGTRAVIRSQPFIGSWARCAPASVRSIQPANSTQMAVATVIKLRLWRPCLPGGERSWARKRCC